MRSASVVENPGSAEISAGVAVRLTLDTGGEAIQTARIVLGCVGATPVRARKAEALITGKQLTPQLTEEAGSAASQECSPTSDLRGYTVRLAAGVSGSLFGDRQKSF